SDPLRSGAGVPNLQRVPGLFGGLSGAADQRSAAAAAPGMMPGIVDPLALGPFPSAWMPMGWQALMQMRAAGLI
ncbi:MAG TPA: hypothetical protein VF915_00640, partial [Reyranella sp.]